MTSIFVVTLKIAVSRRVHSERLISNFFQYIFSQTDFPEKRKREKRIIETDSPGNRWTWLPAASNSSAANSRKRGARKGLETRRETQKRASGSIDEPARVRFRLGFKHRASRLEILVPPFSTRQKKPVKDFPFPSSLSLSLSLSLFQTFAKKRRVFSPHDNHRRAWSRLALHWNLSASGGGSLSMEKAPFGGSSFFFFLSFSYYFWIFCSWRIPDQLLLIDDLVSCK